MPISKSRLFVLVLLFFSSFPAWAAKTDVVFLNNGDRVTGEVKSLERGMLEFKTDHMGTVLIEWEDIEEIISQTGQSVELTNGQRFYGPLAKPENSDMLMVATPLGAIGVSTMDVVSMYPVESGFWNRLDLSAQLGFAWDKGSSVGKYSFGLDAEYRDPKFITRARFTTEITTQQGRDDTSRAVLSASHMVFRENKKFIPYFGNLEQNDELGIDLRALIGAGIGWVPVRSNRNWFSLAGGLAVNREIPMDGAGETNLEAVGMLSYEYYRYASPERKFDVSLTVFPSLTDFGRWRADFSTSFRWEMLSDLFWVLSSYASYDSDPLSINAENSDYGFNSSLAYKF
ncbi:MAG: DUF481 domain-containing protein [Xanthomonadales bacterium]|nr:DUF481 domain-containing protein [Gammaproteobacteria bacterium]MBT8054395.1 DUF481 domain-containing protein [Gammaproteobacteria bacterium]NND56441.1 DUF481 domain-containing protein [Xanthomonadales bacterium]NNK51136.1 DUF481 domain-containing protein [Xanthomonadales bacterium]